MNFYKVLLVLILWLITSSCNWQRKEKHEIRWEPKVCAPREYPVMVFGGILTYPKEGGMYIMPDHKTTNDWGTPDGASMSRFSPEAPDGIGIKWYSYVEDKFYSGFFDLPRDTIQALLSTTLIGADTKRLVGYKYIITGMAPYGVVTVWLYGDGYCKEVGSFKANETEIDIGEYDMALRYITRIGGIEKQLLPIGEKELLMNTLLYCHALNLINQYPRGYGIRNTERNST